MTSIEKIEIYSPYGQKLTLVIGNSDNGLEVRELDGLDPTKSNIVTTSFPRQAGTQRQASRREPRTLKFKLGLDVWFGEESVEALRQSLYAFFMPQMQVRCRYFTGEGLVVDVWGEVEDFVSPRTTDDPEATIQIYCFDPDFIADQPIFQSRSAEEPTGKVLTNVGTVDAGFVFRTTTDRQIREFRLWVRGGDQVEQYIDFDAVIEPEETLVISTIPGSKGAWAYDKAGNRRSVLQGISGDSSWIALRPGDNLVKMSMGGASLDFTLDYSARYGGI